MAALDLSAIQPGLTGAAEMTVGPEHTAPRVGSGRIAVLATPVMINLIEAAALAAVEHLLPPGHQSLGIQLDVGHYAATPVGPACRRGRRGDRGGGPHHHVPRRGPRCTRTIGGGTHKRVVVNVERFDARVQRKLRRPLGVAARQDAANALHDAAALGPLGDGSSSGCTSASSDALRRESHEGLDPACVVVLVRPRAMRPSLQRDAP